MKTIKMKKARRELKKLTLENVSEDIFLNKNERNVGYYNGTDLTREFFVKIKLTDNAYEILFTSSVFGKVPTHERKRMSQYLSLVNAEYNDKISFLAPDENGTIWLKMTVGYDASDVWLTAFIGSIEFRTLFFENSIKNINDGELLSPTEFPEAIHEFERKSLDDCLKELISGETGEDEENE